jgi:hypothetical protein
MLNSNNTECRRMVGITEYFFFSLGISIMSRIVEIISNTSRSSEMLT